MLFFIRSFRDLGTSLQSLRILWLSRSGVTDLDGIGALCGLKELYLAFNDIADLTPLAMHDELQVLDLESNRLSDLNQIDQLGTCPNMVSLTLESNPLCRLEGYRRLVIHHIPQLQLLDDKEVDADDYIEVTSDLLEKAAEMTPVLADGDEDDTSNELGMVQQGIKHAKIDMVSGRAQLHDQNSNKPPLSGQSSRPGTSGSRRPGTSVNSRRSETGASSVMHQMEFNVDTDTGSELTHGTDVVFSGNCAKALRSHRCESMNSGPSPTRAGQHRLSITETLDRAHELEKKGMGDIIAELKAWKLETAVAELASDPQKKQVMKQVRPGTSAGVISRERSWQMQEQNFTSVAQDFAQPREATSVRPGTSACIRDRIQIGVQGDWEGPPQALSARSLGLSQRVRQRGARPGTSGSNHSRPSTAGSDTSSRSGMGSRGEGRYSSRNSGVRGSRDYGDEVEGLGGSSPRGSDQRGPNDNSPQQRGGAGMPPRMPQAPASRAPSKQVKEIAMPLPSATARNDSASAIDQRLVHRLEDIDSDDIPTPKKQVTVTATQKKKTGVRIRSVLPTYLPILKEAEECQLSPPINTRSKNACACSCEANQYKGRKAKANQYNIIPHDMLFAFVPVPSPFIHTLFPPCLFCCTLLSHTSKNFFYLFGIN